MANLDSLSTRVLVTSAGVPHAGAKAYYWADVGATTPLDTYSDAGITTPNTNPVVADSNGAFGAIYLANKRYWRTVTDSSGNALTRYNSGPIDGTLNLVTSATSPSPTYAFMYWYDTTTGLRKRRSSDNASWISEGAIDGLIPAATITQQLAGTDATVASTPDSVAALWQRGTDLASAATVSLPSTGGGVFNITGTTGISAIGSASGGRTICLKFAGALTLTHNATSLILPGAANITTVAGDCARFINEAATDATGSNWRCFNYERASGSALNFTDQLATQANMETATSTTTIVTPGRAQYHPGVAKAWCELDGTGTISNLASNNCSSTTDNGVGDFTFNWTTAFSSAFYATASMIGFGTGGTAATMKGYTSAATKVAASYRVIVASTDFGSSGAADYDSNSIVAFGDQ